MTRQILSVGLVTEELTISYRDINDVTSTTKTVTLTTLPAACKVLGVELIVDTAFSGTGITAITVEVGDPASTNHYLTATSVATTGRTLSAAQFKEYSADNSTIVAKFTATGANLNALSAGQLRLRVVKTTKDIA